MCNTFSLHLEQKGFFTLANLLVCSWLRTVHRYMPRCVALRLCVVASYLLVPWTFTYQHSLFFTSVWQIQKSLENVLISDVYLIFNIFLFLFFLLERV